MGKTIRFKPEERKTETQEYFKDKDWKHKKPTRTNKQELSSKNRHGHFTKLHIWPIRDESKKGHKI